MYQTEFKSAICINYIQIIRKSIFLFVFYALKVGAEQDWSFKKTTWKVLLSSFIPFGTFYIDKHILRKI